MSVWNGYSPVLALFLIGSTTGAWASLPMSMDWTSTAFNADFLFLSLDVGAAGMPLSVEESTNVTADIVSAGLDGRL